MLVLITGQSGFVGQNLLARSRQEASSMRELVLLDQNFDLRNADSMRAALSALRFDHVIHLAAQSNVPASLADPIETLNVNLLGTVRLLETLRTLEFSGRLLYVSSGDVYGIVGSDDLPVHEATPMRPANPYAVSKVAAETAVLSWGRRERFDVIVARPFNHLGPGQSTGFSIARFADALARMKQQGLPPVLTTGRLDVTRDFLDVRDVVEAYFCLLSLGKPGEIYNVCSGIERRLDAVLQQLIELTGLRVELRQDSALMRPADLPRMVGDGAKLRRDTGWSPIIPFSETLQSVLDSFLRIHQSP
jgi:GDP-4-dehydro-6-deoxy-D-mannose reductase